MATASTALEGAAHGHLTRELRFWEAIGAAITIAFPALTRRIGGITGAPS